LTPGPILTIRILKLASLGWVLALAPAWGEDFFARGCGR